MMYQTKYKYKFIIQNYYKVFKKGNLRVGRVLGFQIINFIK